MSYLSKKNINQKKLSKKTYFFILFIVNIHFNIFFVFVFFYKDSFRYKNNREKNIPFKSEYISKYIWNNKISVEYILYFHQRNLLNNKRLWINYWKKYYKDFKNNLLFNRFNSNNYIKFNYANSKCNYWYYEFNYSHWWNLIQNYININFWINLYKYINMFFFIILY